MRKPTMSTRFPKEDHSGRRRKKRSIGQNNPQRMNGFRNIMMIPTINIDITRSEILIL